MLSALKLNYLNIRPCAHTLSTRATIVNHLSGNLPSPGCECQNRSEGVLSAILKMRSTTNPQIPASKFILIHFWTQPVLVCLPIFFSFFFFSFFGFNIANFRGYGDYRLSLLLPLLRLLWPTSWRLTLGDIEMST